MSTSVQQVELIKMPGPFSLTSYLKLLQLYKHAYAGLSRETWILSAVILINRSGTMVIPFMSMYATQKLGFGIAEAGIIMSFFGVGAIIGTFLGGKLTDVIGYQTVQLFSLFGGGILFIILGYLRGFATICSGVLILSIVNEAFRPANATAVAAYSLPENRTRSYSLNRLAINLGWAVGGSLGGFLAASSYQALFWVDGLTNISAGIMLFFSLPGSREKMSAGVKTTLATIEKKSAYHDREYLVFIFYTSLFAFAFFQIFTLLPVFYKMQLHISEKIIGVLMAINGLLIALTEMLLVFVLEKRRNPYRFISYGVWLVGVSYLLFNVVAGQFAIALISTLLFTIGEMLSMPFMNSYWIGRSTESNRGQYAALYAMAWSASQIAAPSIGGWIADRYNFEVLFWILCFTCMVAGLGYLRMMAVKIGPGKLV